MSTDTPIVTNGKKRLNPDTAQGRFERFFIDNPDEELTVSDICAKFDVKPFRAHEMVKVAKGRIGLESLHVVRMRSQGRAQP